MSTYLATPTGTTRGGLLVLHAWWGLNDFTKSFCNRLAGEGYLVLAPDLYHGAVATTIPDAKKLRGKLKRDMAAQEILQALTELQSHPGVTGKPLGVIGFSLGAFWTLWLAETNPDVFKAVVLFYGNRGGEYAGAKAAFLGHFAGTDPYVSESGRKKLERTLKSAGKETSFHVYPGTGHWLFESNRPEYDPDAASLAWQRTVDFLHTHV